jgi:hypothetical protein
MSVSFRPVRFLSLRSAKTALCLALITVTWGSVWIATALSAQEPASNQPAAPKSAPAKPDTSKSDTAKPDTAKPGPATPRAKPDATKDPRTVPRGDRRPEEPDFARRIKDVVNPHFDGEQFGDGSTLHSIEDRYNVNFQVASFDDAFNDDYVGGILLRSFPEKPVKVLHLKSATFRLEDGPVEQVLFRLNTDSDQFEFRVPATIVPAAALMAADKRLVLLTLAVGSGPGRSHVDMAATHPAIANHQLGYMAAQLDLSLSNVMAGHGRNYLLCEKAWHLSPKAFTTRDDLFTVRCRVGRTETTPPGITDSFRARLGDDQRRYFRVLNNFVTVRRLVRAVIGHYVVGFPENDFIKLLTQLQPVYEKYKMTKEQADEMHLMLTRF